jgi:hypothetical protein
LLCSFSLCYTPFFFAFHKIKENLIIRMTDKPGQSGVMFSMGHARDFCGIFPIIFLTIKGSLPLLSRKDESGNMTFAYRPHFADKHFYCFLFLFFFCFLLSAKNPNIPKGRASKRLSCLLVNYITS